MTPRTPEKDSRRRGGRRLREDDVAAMPTRIELRAESDGSVLAISGPLNVETAAAARRQIEAELAAARVSRIEVDASGVDRGDLAGVSLLHGPTEGGGTPGGGAGGGGREAGVCDAAGSVSLARIHRGAGDAPRSEVAAGGDRRQNRVDPGGS